MEVEGDALMAVETDLFFNTNDSNKCQCPSPIVESTTAVDNANVSTDFVVVDVLAVDLSSVLQVVASIICRMYGSEQLKYSYQER